MSSQTDSIKQPAEDAAGDEPNAKKVKLANDNDQANVETENVTTTLEKVEPLNGDKKSNNNNNNVTDNQNNSLNGEDKLSDDNNDIIELGDEDDDDDDDDDLDDEDGDGTDARGDGMYDPTVAKVLEQVENIQHEICNLNEKASEEILKVEQKFNKLRRPHFEKRNNLLKGIPNFWLTSLANHPIIAPMIDCQEDVDCLHYMINLDVEEFEDIKSGYRLKLHFVENPYIANDVIVKEFQVVSSEEIVSSSTPIEYKNTPEGKNLKQVVETSIEEFRRHRNTDQRHQSFFAWLVEPSDSGIDEVADILKDQIWPNPLDYYFQQPADDYGSNSDDSDDEDEEIDDEDVDDEDDGDMPEGVDGISDDDLDDGEGDDDDDLDEEEL